MPDTTKLFTGIPDKLSEKLVETLMATGSFRIERIVGYLSRLKARMLKVGFTQDDLLYQLVSQSYYAIQALSMQFHYLSCKSGVGRPSE